MARVKYKARHELEKEIKELEQKLRESESYDLALLTMNELIEQRAKADVRITAIDIEILNREGIGTE